MKRYSLHLVSGKEPFRLAACALGLVLSGCPQKGDDGKRTAELADQLVTCQNEKNNLKEELGGAKAEVAKLKAEAAVEKEPAAEGQPRQGRAMPRKPQGAASSVRRGPENPAAEAAAAKTVAGLVKSHVGQFRPCYERGLKRNANLQFVTQVKIRVTATPEGRAEDIKVIPKTDGEMEACIAQAISRWKMPVYKGQPVVLEVPVNLKVQAE